MTVQLQEAAGTLMPDAAGKRFRARLIEGDIWGSSGYYAREVLERDGPTTWPAGTQIYLDHPGATENFDRPERSVRDLAGKIASTPIYESDGLYADVEFYPHVAPVIEAMWQDVGMSIRASASVENGEAAGRRGPIIQSLENGLSVDVVTQAGAGGKLVTLLESAREGAATAVHETATHNSLPIPAGPIKEKEGPTMGTTIEESRLAQLEEASGRVPVLEAENEALKADNKALRESAVKADAAKIVAEAFDGIEAPSTISRLAESYKLTDDGKLDADALKAVAEESAAEWKVAHGAGSVSGIGDTTPPAPVVITTESAREQILAASGYTPKGAN